MDIQDSAAKLLDVVQHGDVHKARELLDEGCDPNVKSDSGQTPLHIAVEAGFLNVAELLLNHGANPHTKSSDGSTSLHYAAQSGRDQFVQLLLEYWADPNSKDFSGLTPLHKAANKDNPAAVRLLLESEADSQALDAFGNTPLHLAAGEDVARLLGGGAVNLPQRLTQQTAIAPMFPIIINGNHLDEAIEPAADASGTNYILVQSRAGLSPPQKQDLAKAGVMVHDYVSKNTYLCYFEDSDLDRLRQMEPFVYVDVYRAQFKVSSASPPPPTSLGRKIKLDLIFHKDVNSESQTLQDLVATASGVYRRYIRFCPHKARLEVDDSRLRQIEQIDEVRRIEEVGEIVLWNNTARPILGCDNQQPLCAVQGRAYQGDGQVIAVADTGLD